MKIIDIPFTRLSPGGSQIKVAGFTVEQTLIDFMPNLSVPLLGMKNFLSNFVLTVDYPNLRFSLDRK